MASRRPYKAMLFGELSLESSHLQPSSFRPDQKCRAKSGFIQSQCEEQLAEHAA